MENQIIARLRDRLGTARNANEMFRVFSKFNALFVRPKVGFFSITTSILVNPGAYRFVALYKSIRHSSSTLSRRISNDYTTRSVSNWR